MHSLGVYISVPFCKAKCSFCNFASGAIGSGPFAQNRIGDYIDRVCSEIRSIKSHTANLNAALPHHIDTIYFGGGTPSLLEPSHLQSIFSALRNQFTLSTTAEITLECAPGQLEQATLDEAMRQGINRISFGVQSFVDRETSAVGRLHTASQCIAEIARIRAAGLHEISLDLIAGLPGQTAASWQTSLDAVLETQVPHASVYMLEVDEDSRLGKELITGGPRYQASTVPTDEAMTEFYARACEAFNAAGLAQYEISNFAREGHASIHNLKYWQRRPYLGFGLDAHSMLHRGAGSIRWANTDDLAVYMKDSYRNEAPYDLTDVDTSAALEESLFLGLRMNVGISLHQLESEFGTSALSDCSASLQNLVHEGLLHRTGDRIALTARGREVSNEVFAELLLTVAA